jgi:hypothetical protein
MIGILEGQANPAQIFAFSSTGRFLATGSWDGTVRVWDVAARRQLTCLQGKQGGIRSLAFSPDDVWLAAGGVDTTVLVWDLSRFGLPKEPRPSKPSIAALEKMWQQLDSEDPSEAFESVWKLAAEPSTLPFLRKRIMEVLPTDARISRLLAELDHSRFQVREQAARELRGFGPSLEPRLRRALRNSRSEETRRRLENVLRRLAPRTGSLPAQEVRAARAIQVLQSMKVPAAQEFLQQLVEAGSESFWAREARAALESLLANH